MSLLPSKPDTSTVDDTEPRVIGVDSDDADDVISALSSETARKLLAELHEEPAPPSELSDRVDTSLQNAQYHLKKLEAAGAVSVVDTAYSAKGREMDVYAPADQPLVIFAGDEERTTGLKAALSRLLGGVGVLGVASLAIQSLFGGSDRVVQAPTSGSGGDGGNGGGPGSGGNGAAAGGNGDAGGVAGNGSETPVRTNAEATSGGDGGSYSISDIGTEEEETTTTTTEQAVNETADTVVDTTTTVVKTTAQAGDQLTDNATEAVDKAASAVPPGLLFFAGGTLVLALWLVVWYARN